MGKNPAFQFYPKDWLSDPQLRAAPFEVKGLWIDILSIMWFSESKGKISGTQKEISRIIGCTEEDIAMFLVHAEHLRFCDISRDGGTVEISNRRMVREERERELNRTAQARFREKGGGDPERWVAIRVSILKRDNYTCAYCGRKANTVDHVHPRSKGGGEDDFNLVACCKSCNMKKNNRSLIECNMSFWKGFDVSKLLNNTSITPILLSPGSPSPGSPSPFPSSSEEPSPDPSQTPLSDSANPTPRAKVPYEEIRFAYNAARQGLMVEKRSFEPTSVVGKAVASNWKRHPDLSWFNDLFTRVNASPFLRGETKEHFICSLGWIIKPANMEKILDGNYDDRSKQMPTLFDNPDRDVEVVPGVPYRARNGEVDPGWERVMRSGTEGCYVCFKPIGQDADERKLTEFEFLRVYVREVKANA